MTDAKVAVVAVGGNALIKDKTKRSIADQYEAAQETMRHIAEMIESGWNVVITPRQRPAGGVHPAPLRTFRPRTCTRFPWITAVQTPRAPSATCSSKH